MMNAMSWPEALVTVVGIIAWAAVMIGMFGEWPNFRRKQ